MGSSGSSAGSLRRSNQSSRTGLGGRGCCAAAVSGRAAAALPSKAINSRLFMVASPCVAATGSTLVPRCGTAQWLLHPRDSECSPHLAVKATSLVEVRKGSAPWGTHDLSASRRCGSYGSSRAEQLRLIGLYMGARAADLGSGEINRARRAGLGSARRRAALNLPLTQRDCMGRAVLDVARAEHVGAATRLRRQSPIIGAWRFGPNKARAVRAIAQLDRPILPLPRL